MKRFKRRLIHMLLAFYLFSSYLGDTHIHDEGYASHDSCKVCIVVKNLHSGDAPATFALIRLQYLVQKNSTKITQNEEGELYAKR